MPSYDYECKKCKAQFEVTMTMKERDTAKVKCPKCGSTETFQIFSKLQMVDDMTTPEMPDVPQGPPPGMGGMGMPPMGGMPPGMCGPGGCGF